MSMAVRVIVKLGNPILRIVAQKIAPDRLQTSAIRELIVDLIVTMRQARGIGIAAPQVGVSLQIAIINAKDKPFVIVNPIVTKKSLRSSVAEEGCLSIPGVFGQVRRPENISVAYLDERGQPRTAKASGMLARVFQHEIDHLNGILFIDRATNLTETRS
ncbi:MAG: peptide deformylase [Candidatus Kerfeldbacteria bacterium]|nr:peptide deformylase [Candidatus Kerfeldbacteria bacterium]